MPQHKTPATPPGDPDPIAPIFSFAIPADDSDERLPPAHNVGDVIAGWKLTRVIAPAASESSATIYEVVGASPSPESAVPVNAQVRAAMKLFGSRTSMRRFRLHATTLGEVRHEGLVRVIDWGVLPSGFPFLVMDLVQGPTFDIWLAEAAPSVSSISEILAQAAHAVGSAHAEFGLVHRDLKPSNVMVEQREHEGKPVWRARVIDFGVALLIRDSDSPPNSLATHGGTIVGTPAYMAPEQFYAGARAVDPRADVYALGVMLFEAFSGRRPLNTDGLSIVEAAQRKEAARISARTIQRLAGKNSRPISRPTASVIAAALSPDPEDRPANGVALAEELRRASRGQPPLHKHPGILRRTHRFLARERRVAAVLAVLAVVGTVSVIAISILAIRTESARRAEQAQTDRLVAMVKSWTQGAFLRAFQTPGSEAALVPVTEAVIRALEEASRVRPDDIELLDQLALSYAQLANVVGMPGARSLGDEPRARALHDQSIDAATRSAALYKSQNRPDADLARLSIANAIKRRVGVTPDAAERQSLMERARSIADEVYTRYPENDEVIVSVAGTLAAWAEAQPAPNVRIDAFDRTTQMLELVPPTSKRAASIRHQIMILHLTIAGELAPTNPKRAAQELQVARTQFAKTLDTLSLEPTSLNPKVPREAMLSRLAARFIMLDAQIAAAEHRWSDARRQAAEATRQTRSLVDADLTSGPSALDHATRQREHAQVLLAAAAEEPPDRHAATMREAAAAATDAISTIESFMPERPRTYLEQTEIDQCRAIIARTQIAPESASPGPAPRPSRQPD